MTKIKNNPGSKHVRRIGAKARLENLIARYETILQNNPIQGNILLKDGTFTREQIMTKVMKANAEIGVLEVRIRTGGKKSTKNVHANTGRRSF